MARQHPALGDATPIAGQLDLFAAIEDAEQERLFDEAPSIFDTQARGYFARVAASEQWCESYGHFDSIRRSHAWRAEMGGPHGADEWTDTCRPTILTADLGCDHDRLDCFCVGGLVYRGACLHCQWEGPTRDDANPAVEDAHDHAWEGWRGLPTVPSRPPSPNRKTTKAMARWVAQVNDLYPSGWLESGGPVRTLRDGPYGTRHVPAYTGFGGYDLCAGVVPERPS